MRLVVVTKVFKCPQDGDTAVPGPQVVQTSSSIVYYCVKMQASAFLITLHCLHLQEVKGRGKGEGAETGSACSQQSVCRCQRALAGVRNELTSYRKGKSNQKREVRLIWVIFFGSLLSRQ